jgi:cell division protein FtsN
MNKEIYPFFKKIPNFANSNNTKSMKKQLSILSVAASLFLCGAYTKSYAQSKRVAKPTTTVNRSMSAKDDATEIVTITITKDAYRGHAFIEEDFSSDLQATEISGASASFKSSPGKATFEWDNISEDKTITVSYSLSAIRKTSENQSVTGHLLYQNQTFNMAASNFTIKYTGKMIASYSSSSTPVDASNTNTLQDLYYVVFGEYPGGMQGSTSDNTYTTTASVNKTAPISKPSKKHEEAPTPPPVQPKPVVAQAPPPPPAQPTPTPTPAPAPVDNTAVASPAPVPPAATTSTAATPDLVYRIQIAAVGDKSKVPDLLAQDKITDTPYLESVNASITRVMIGAYPNLSSAKARIDQLKASGVTGAYVAPYYKGKRVSLQEAASHTNQ